jgi:hypothetical protein
MLINPRLDIPPILYKSIRDFDSRSIGYRKEIRQAVVELQQQRIIICGITTDNLKAQIMAFGDTLKGDELIERKKDPMQCLRRVPCQCHTMSLVINDLISRSIFQSDYFLIEKAVNFVRKKSVSSRIRSICPPICRTRWRNLFLIFKWFKNNYKKIQQFIIDSGPEKHYVLTDEIEALINVIYAIMPTNYPLFLLFDLLIRKLESDNCMFAEVILVYRSFINILKSKIPQYSFENGGNTIGNFLYFMNERLHTTADYRLLYVMSVFLPAGRHNIRNQMDLFELESEDLFDSLPHNDEEFFALHVTMEEDLKQFKLKIVDVAATDQHLILDIYSADTPRESDTSADDDVHLNFDDSDLSHSDDTDMENDSDIINEESQPRTNNNKTDENRTDLVIEENQILPENQNENGNAEEANHLHFQEANVQNNMEADVSDVETQEESASQNLELNDILLYEIEEAPDPTVCVESNCSLQEILNFGEQFIDQLATDFKISPPASGTWGTAFINFISSRTEQLDIAHHCNNNLDSIWTLLLINNKMRGLAKIAKYLLSIPASEASAERAFALQKKIMDSERTQMKPDLEKARITCRYMCDAQKRQQKNSPKN